MRKDLQEKRRLNDVWVLDLATFTWHKPQCDKNAPAPRDGAAATFCLGHMVIFGGHAAGKRLNDLSVLDLSTFAWSTWTSVLGAPAPRERAALCAGHGNLLFLHGGSSNFGMDDLWVFDVKASAWTEVHCAGRRPGLRRGHDLYVHDSWLYLFGGFDELGAPGADMWRLRVDYGTPWQTAKPAWDELVSDRAFNRNRCGTESS